MDRLLLIAGRVLMSIIFIWGGIGKIRGFEMYVKIMASKGIPMTKAALAVVIVVELVGGLMLLAGVMPRMTSLVLFVYLIPVSVTMHNFWTMTGQERSSNQINFLKNVAIMGGLLAVASRERK